MEGQCYCINLEFCKIFLTLVLYCKLSMMSFITNRHRDEFEYYYEWKSDIEKNTLPLSEEEKQKVKDSLTSRRLSKRLSLASKDGLQKLDLQFNVKTIKVKSNREVDMINKWREVDRAHDDLENIREAHLKKLKQYEV